ncbi:hypothetical protein EJ04DRAFT_15297 [Polyplosphaeria fusca]|uniref:Uncharacterized protein n=1 Tax=Polyplosphaeria fusca TaxID=682080 RepID=A0A9P4QUH3_9PLEO|nr:hypothetical protein EJ04DRAFT_15297 [Polyplosphaeria fusca]
MAFEPCPGGVNVLVSPFLNFIPQTALDIRRLALWKVYLLWWLKTDIDLIGGWRRDGWILYEYWVGVMGCALGSILSCVIAKRAAMSLSVFLESQPQYAAPFSVCDGPA